MKTVRLNGRDLPVLAKAIVKKVGRKDMEVVCIPDVPCGPALMWTAPNNSFMSLGIYGMQVADMIKQLKECYPLAEILEK